MSYFSLRVCLLYFVCCVRLDNNSVIAQNEKLPPNVNPSQSQENLSIEQQGDIKFHDPSEFAERDYLRQENVNVYQQDINQQNGNQANKDSSEEINHGNEPPHAPHAHEEHGHGIGDSVDAEHMKEHEKENFVDYSKMTQSQVIMHHFRQFDQNKDGKVDGLEIYKKIQMENEEHASKTPKTSTKSKEDIQNDMDRLAALVDNSLKAYDENDDGYIYYGEFYRAHSNNKDYKDDVQP